MLRIEMVLLGLVCVFCVYCMWNGIAMNVANYIFLLTWKLETVYQDLKRDENYFEEWIIERGFKDVCEAIKKIDKDFTKIIKGYKRFYKLVPSKEIRLMMGKKIEKLEEIRDKFKELQEKQ